MRAFSLMARPDSSEGVANSRKGFKWRAALCCLKIRSSSPRLPAVRKADEGCDHAVSAQPFHSQAEPTLSSLLTTNTPDNIPREQREAHRASLGPIAHHPTSSHPVARNGSAPCTPRLVSCFLFLVFRLTCSLPVTAVLAAALYAFAFLLRELMLVNDQFF